MLVRSGRLLGLFGALIPLAVAATWQIASSIQSSTVERLKIDLDSQRRQSEAAQAELKAQLQNAVEKNKYLPPTCPEPAKRPDDAMCEAELARLRTEHEALRRRGDAPKEVAVVEPQARSIAPAILPPTGKPGRYGLLDQACGAVVSSIAGHDVEPLSGLQELLKPGNEDCVWGAPGLMLMVDLIPCSAAYDGISSLKVRLSSAPGKPDMRWRRTNTEVVLSAAGTDQIFREIFRKTSMADVEVSKEGAPIKGTRFLRLEIRGHSDYKQKLCGIEVR